MCRVDALQWKLVDPCYRMLGHHYYCIEHSGTLSIRSVTYTTTRFEKTAFVKNSNLGGSAFNKNLTLSKKKDMCDCLLIMDDRSM